MEHALAATASSAEVAGLKRAWAASRLPLVRASHGLHERAELRLDGAVARGALDALTVALLGRCGSRNFSCSPYAGLRNSWRRDRRAPSSVSPRPPVGLPRAVAAPPRRSAHTTGSPGAAPRGSSRSVTFARRRSQAHAGRRPRPPPPPPPPPLTPCAPPASPRLTAASSSPRAIPPRAMRPPPVRPARHGAVRRHDDAWSAPAAALGDRSFDAVVLSGDLTQGRIRRLVHPASTSPTASSR